MFGAQAQPTHQPLVFGLQAANASVALEPRSISGDRCRKHPEPFDRYVDLSRAQAVQLAGDLVGEGHADVADETQRNMVVLRFHPARARQSARAMRQARGFVRWISNPVKRRGISFPSLAGRGRGGRAKSVDQNRLDKRQEPFDDPLDSLCIGMQAVWKHQFGPARHALRERTVERDHVFPGRDPDKCFRIPRRYRSPQL